MYEVRSTEQEEVVHAIVILTFVSAQEGGRNITVSSMYRPQFAYGGSDWVARYTFAEAAIQPGQTMEAIVEFLNPASHQNRLYPGMEFVLREGTRTVAHGTITWVNETFSPSSAV